MFDRLVYRLAVSHSPFLDISSYCSADPDEVNLALKRLVDAGVVFRDVHGVFSVYKPVKPRPGLKRVRYS